MRFSLKKPCNECPFRLIAPAGWLGPWKALQIVQSLALEPFPCHKTISENAQDYADDSLQGCAGAAIFLNNKIELSRCPETARHQKLLKGTTHAAEVFTRTAAFVEHHEGTTR